MVKKDYSLKERLLKSIITMLIISIFILISNNISTLYLMMSGWDIIRLNNDRSIFISDTEMLIESFNGNNKKNEQGEILLYTFETITLNDKEYKPISKENFQGPFCINVNSDDPYTNEKTKHLKKFSLNCQQVFVQATDYNAKNKTDYEQVYITENYVWLLKGEKLFVLKNGSDNSPSYVTIPSPIIGRQVAQNAGGLRLAVQFG